MKQNFVEAMASKREERAAEVGKHTWKQTIERYGLGYLFIEIASIVSRMEEMIWPPPENGLTEQQLARLDDLTIDLGNYAGFLYDALVGYEMEIQANAAGAPVEEVTLMWREGAWNG